jgi:hypothetical protein
VTIEVLEEVWVANNIVFQALFTIIKHSSNNTFGIKLLLNSSDVPLIGSKAIILTKISNYPASTEDRIKAVKGLLNLLKSYCDLSNSFRANINPTSAEFHTN